MFIFLFPFFISVTNGHLDSLVIKITSGLIEGQYVHSPVINKSYYSFRGIPYAEPPLDELRFRPPVAPKPWNYILETKADGSQCVQKFGGSEDCLFLNVFTPTLPCNEESNELLPVMFYIHGGGLIVGSSNSSDYGPEYLINKNVVLVTINYRLNIFGFLNAMEESAPGNVGLKDQVAALQWVQENIKQFNGDPKRVTIFGHSGGSGSVNYHLQSKLSKDLFQNAILQSGTSLNKWALERNPLEVLHKLENLLNIDTKNITEFVDKLRDLSCTELYNAAAHPDLLNMNQFLVRIRFIPSVEYNSSDSFIIEDSYSLLKKNKVNSVPVLIGHVSNEGAVLHNPIVQKIFNFNFTFYKNNIRLLVPTSLNIVNDTTIENAILEEIKDHYFKNDSISWNTALANYGTDEEFLRGIRKTVDFLRKYNSVYFYIFDHEENNTEYTGVPHAGELKYLFYSPESKEANKEVINKMTTLWTNFAKTGNPTLIEDSALDNIIWPTVPRNPKEKIHYLVIRKKLRIVKDSWQKTKKFWRKIFNTYGRKPYLLY